MADEVLASVASVYENLRKATAATGFVVKDAAGSVVTSSPIIQSGTGAPTASTPQGSLYLRTDGTSNTTLYTNTDGAGAWEAVEGGADFGSGGLSADVIAESTGAAGVTVDGLLIKDSAIAPVVGGAAFIDLTAAATGEADVILADNLASAFQLREAATAYLTVVTTNDAEAVQFDQDTQRVSTARDLTHQTRWEVHDELNGKADTEAEHGWILNSGTDAQAIDPALDTAQAGGVWQLVTGDLDGTTAADGSGMVWADMPIRLDSAGGNTIIECRIRIKSAITTVSVGFGLTDATGLEEPFTGSADTITSTATDAVGFLFDSENTTQEWFGCAVDTDTDDTGNATTTVAPVADTWQILTIEISNDGATINFYVNGGAASLALSGAAGVGPDVVLYPYLIANATTTTSRTVDVDYVRVESVR